MPPESLAPNSLSDVARTDASQVRHFRQILLWPLRLVLAPGARNKRPWQVLEELGATSPWKEAVDEYTGEVSRFHERHYHEFVTFLPYVQQFLYGEIRSRRTPGDRG